MRDPFTAWREGNRTDSKRTPHNERLGRAQATLWKGDGSAGESEKVDKLPTIRQHTELGTQNEDSSMSVTVVGALLLRFLA